MAISSLTRGIFPSDVVLRDVIKGGLKDLRRNPFMLDDIFQPFLADDDTSDVYGQAEARAAKEWFLNNDVPVKIADIPEPPTGTSIVIQLADSREDNETLADIHYDPTDVYDREWPVLVGPIDPMAYDSMTGFLTMPANFTFVAVDGMVAVDAQGTEHPILAVPQTRILQIEPNLQLDFRGLTIRGERPTQGIALESVEERETYQIGVHVAGHQNYLTYLFAIFKYVMYRSRQELERRGMDRVVYMSGDTEQGQYGAVENVYSRYMTVQASVRQTWTKQVGAKLLIVDTTIQIDMDADVLSGVGAGPILRPMSLNVPSPSISIPPQPQPGSFLANHVEVPISDQVYVDGANEQVMDEFLIDFSPLTSANVECTLFALTRQTNSASGVYRVRLGGTSGAVDGAIVCTLTATHAGFPTSPDLATGTPFVTPTGGQIVKITGNASDPAARATLGTGEIRFISV